MTLSTQTTKVTVLGNGAQSVFTYSFLLPTAGQYALYYTDADGLISLVSQANYTVSGIGVATGGTFTYLPSGVPIATGTSLTLVRAVPNTQIYEFGNQGAYYPQQVEGALDRLDMQVQQLQTLANLSFKVPFTNANVADVPTLVDRANTWAYFNANGDLVGSATAGPGSSVGNLLIEGDQSLQADPVANPVNTFSSFIVSGTTAQDNEREFLVSIGLISNRGAAASSPERDKVGLYVGLLADSGTGDVWSFNTVLTMYPGAAAYNAQGHELDLNNLNGHRGDTPGAAGLAAPVAYGMSITGVASYRSTSALILTAAGAGVWNRGLTITDGVVQSSIQDLGTADRALDLQGAYDYAIDLSASTNTAAAIQMGNNHFVRGMDTGATARALIGIDTSDQVLVGNSAQTLVLAATGAIVPYADNTVSFGNGSLRPTELFAVTGTVNTSDPKMKKDIAPLGSMLPLLREIRPIAFKFKEGGGSIETVMEEQLAPVYETADVEDTVVDVVGGVAVERKIVKRVERRVVDEFPVVDDKGEPVYDWTKPVRDRHGQIVRPAVRVRRTRRVPRTAKQQVPVQHVVTRPGKRTHMGFSATEVQAAVQKLGMGDIGVYVRDRGVEGLRTDQLVAALWQVAREQDAEIAAIKALLVI